MTALNTPALLALIGDLYARIGDLEDQNLALREVIAERDAAEAAAEP